MKKYAVIALVLSLVLISACSKDEAKKVDDSQTEVLSNETKVESPKEEVKQEDDLVEEIKADAVEEETPVALKDYEQVALDFFNDFLNSDNLDDKKNYLDNHINSDVQQAFSLGLSAVTDEDKKFIDPQFVSSADYSANGIVDGKVVLFTSGDKEAVVLVNNGKVGWVFYSTDSSKEGFDSVRGLIK